MMTFTYTRLLSCFAAPVLKKHICKFSHVYSANKYSSPTRKICSRYICEKSVDFYADIEDDDFGNHEEMSSYKNVNFESIAKGDPEKMKMLKRIQLEIDVIAQEGGHVPEKISPMNWVELLSCTSRHQRLRQIHFLYTVEQKKLIKKRKQELLKNELRGILMTKEPRPEFTTNSSVEYGLLATTLFYRIYDSEMKKLYNFRLLQASMFGPHLIIDCSYDNYMSQADLSGCSKDILNSWSYNRDHFYPFDIIFCNMNQDSDLFSRLYSVLPALKNDPAFPFNFTGEHYLDLFPKEQLVYLTPHCNEELESFDGNSVYIIGGLWDKSKDFTLTLAKAKKEGIRRAKFPLDKYMKWTSGKKTLSISECVRIMNDLKDNKSWNFALRHIKKKQMRRCDLFGDGRIKETNPKTTEHLEELLRRKHVYDSLLIKTGKENK